MRRRPSNRGYVLLLTLILLAVAAMALAGVSRAGLQKAVQAARAQENLQRRWTVLSCRTALLRKADLVFADASGAADSPSGSRAERPIRLELGGHSVTILLGDEGAKANVNLLYALRQRAGAERAVRELTQAAGSSARIELSPVLPQDAAGPGDAGDEEPEIDAELDPEVDGRLAELEVESLFEGWGQVFPAAPPHELVRRRGALPSVAGQLTCWGDGLLNARRASREALLKVCDGVLSPAHVTKLLAARDEDPDFDLWETLEALKLSEGRLADAERLLSDQSTCYSIWIVTRAGPREWYHLAVAELGPNGPTDTRLFEW